jgi:hypothetical protein
MEAQVSAEVRNAVIALNAARTAAEAAASSRKLQEQLFSAETERFNAGFSTNFNLVQQQAYLAQSENDGDGRQGCVAESCGATTPRTGRNVAAPAYRSKSRCEGRQMKNSASTLKGKPKQQFSTGTAGAST